MLTFGVCMKYLKEEEAAKDAVQQIFIKVFSELHKYKVEYFKSWLYMVAKNYCLMQLRGSKKNKSIELNEALVPLSDTTIESELLNTKEQALEQLEMGLSALQEDQRICVTMFYLQKKSYREIAEITGHSLMQVKSNIQNGKRNLRIYLERSKHHD